MSFSLKSIPLHSSFLKPGEEFLSEVKPTPFKSESKLIHFNKSAARLLDLKEGVEHEKSFTDIFSGKQPIQNAKPFAMLYAGHQFGHFNPQLGDGRAIIIAEVLNKEKMKWELQLKGSGLTPYSRDGDGRAVLRSTIREYLCSEAMHGLGIPTTRALSIIGSDDEVYRENIERGAILTRLAPSHIRFGSFEVFYYRQQYDQIRTLADYVLKHYYPELMTEKNPYLALLTEVIKRTAKLISLWQSVGFAHGVMNSDNMSILGLTLDYGPYGFLAGYQPGYICNHSDHQGRYAFDQQLVEDLLNLMNDDYVDYTIFFRRLCDFDSTDSNNNAAIRDIFKQRDQFYVWAEKYQQRLSKEDISNHERMTKMKLINPKYILRNYMAEVAIKKAEENDFSEIENLFNLLQHPFSEQAENEKYADFPPEWAQEISVSCSS